MLEKEFSSEGDSLWADEAKPWTGEVAGLQSEKWTVLTSKPQEVCLGAEGRHHHSGG